MKIGPVPIHHPHTYYWMLRHRIASLWPEKSEFNGFRIYHTPDTMPYPASFLRHVAPREMYDLLSKLHGRVAVDAGACIGFYSLHFARNFREVYSFEPHPKNVEFLHKNIRANRLRNIHVFPYALGAESGQVSLWVKDHYKASSSLIPNHLGQPLTEELTVPIVKLDSLPFLRTDVDLVKVDVEGAEVEVLEGAEQLIRANRPVLAVEVHSDPLGDPCRCRCCSRIERLGYRTVETRYHLVEAPDTNRTTIHWVLAYAL